MYGKNYKKFLEKKCIYIFSKKTKKVFIDTFSIHFFYRLQLL